MYSFNPYKILNVEEGATPKEIKSATAARALCARASAAFLAAAAPSRHRIHAPSASVITSAAGRPPPPHKRLTPLRGMPRYHPDKNAGDAQDMFIKVAKPRCSPTRPPARTEYGNPDGYHGVVTIGLPSWLEQNDSRSWWPTW